MFKAFSVLTLIAVFGISSSSLAVAANGDQCHHYQSGRATPKVTTVPSAPTVTANGTTQTRSFSYEPEVGTGNYRIQNYRSPSRRSSQSFGIRDAGSKARGQY